MHYAVIDTNVLVSALLKFQSIPGQIIKEVLARPKFKFDKNDVEILINGIINRGIFVDAKSVVEFIPDPDDAVFYEVVMEGRKKNSNSYLVTGNIKHFPVKPFIVTPKEMYDILHN